MTGKSRLGSKRRDLRGWLTDLFLAIALALLGVGNLMVPPDFDAVLGVDYLILVVAALGLVVLLRLPILVERGRTWVFCASILLVAAPGFVVAPIGGYGISKAQSFVLIALAVVGASAFRFPARGIRAVLVVMSVASVWLAIMVMAAGNTTSSGRVSVLGLNPVGVARLTGVFIVVGAAVLLATRTRFATGLAVLAGIGICLAATVTTGSRGPIVAAFAGAFAILLLALRARQARARWLVIATAIGVAAFALALRADLGGLARILDAGDSGRSGLYEVASQIALTHPLGIGWGMFAEYGWQWVSEDGRLYPHNLFLEVWMEGGIIALVGFSVIILVVLKMGVSAYLTSPEPLRAVVVSIFIYALVNAQFSSDVVGNRLLWVSMGLVVALAGRERAVPVEPRVSRIDAYTRSERV